MNIHNIDYAKDIIQQEIDAIKIFKESLDTSFSDAVDLLYQNSGHVIVSGIGKSGHICKKIAATMSSTGTHSFFLHPTEANHGDLGMISKNDILLVFSFSGNTQELIPMLNYAHRFGIKVIGVTANSESKLANASDIAIIIPYTSEACPYNLAPTTSTMVMMALGDSLALCLLKKRGFRAENFKQLHPGGALGKQLLTVGDLMHKNVPLVKEHDLMSSVLIEMTNKSFGVACVIDEKHHIMGIITDGDLRRAICDNLLKMKAYEVMSRNPKIVQENMLVTAAINLMNTLKITSLFIANKNKEPYGILHIHDCLRAGIA